MYKDYVNTAKIPSHSFDYVRQDSGEGSGESTGG